MKSRRDIVGVLAASGAALASTAGTKVHAAEDIEKDTDIACLYHCDFGDPQRFSAMLQYMNNHYSAYDFDPFKLKLVIVAHASAIKFFLEDLTGTPWENETIDPDLYKRLVGVAKYGVDAYLCRLTYKLLNIDTEKTKKDSFIKFIPSGAATVAELQGKGFAYLKVG